VPHCLIHLDELDAKGKLPILGLFCYGPKWAILSHRAVFKGGRKPDRPCKSALAPRVGAGFIPAR